MNLDQTSVLADGINYDGLTPSKIKLPESEKPFFCQSCNLRFGLKQTYLSHLNDFHKIKFLPERPYACDKCRSAYKNLFNWKKHKKSMHSEEISAEKLSRKDEGK